MANSSKSAGKKRNTSSAKSGSRSAGRSKAAEKEIRKATGSDVRDEIWSIIIIAIGILLILAMFTPASIGPVGGFFHGLFLGCFGILGYVLPFYLIVYGVLLILNKTVHITGRSFTLMMLVFLMLTLLNASRYAPLMEAKLSWDAIKSFYLLGQNCNSAGIFGMLLGALISKAIGRTGLVIVAIVGILVCAVLIINTPFTQFLEDSKASRIERRIRREEEILAYEEEQEALRREREKEKEVNAKYKQMTKSKAAAALSASAHEKELTPAEKAKRMAAQKNILSYVNDESLFEGGESVIPSGAETDFSESGKSNTAPTATSAISSTGSHIAVSGAAESADMFAKPAESAAVSAVTATAAKSAPAAEPVKKLTKSEAANAMLSNEEINKTPANPEKPYEFPSIDLLNKSKGNTGNSESALRNKAVKLEETLHNFHVDAKVVAVTQGPAVTRYEIQPAVGVKVSSITRLADDIALNLEAKSIRIEAPIPGKAAVGIEVENEKINVVGLRELIDSKEFKEAKSKISFAVGKDIAGNIIIGDLKAMPHLLIAGSTGSGKSVCVNSIILSILYKARPEEVKLVLIDPKVVELGNYNGIPHLLIPVVTEPSKAAAALNWAVSEMDERYRKFAEVEVRDLASYNDYVKANQEPDLALPQVVIIIDELADLMMAAPSQVEESICRLAQKARAAGMHLIVATQRPSVDVVTGLIKTNVPSRIAFAVSSQIDSRVILDKTGAEKLVGKGDMLYNPLGMGQPIRVQGAFVSDSEVHNVLEHVKKQMLDDVQYSTEVLDNIERANAPESDPGDTDELLPEAIETVVRAGQASVSMLQRRFRIGYNRAARIVDMMEARGIIGPADGSRPRQVLMTEEELENLNTEE